jgi:large subunit ribosomal protein L30
LESEIKAMAKKKEEATPTTGTFKIQYYRSSIGYSHRQKATVRCLGITKLNQIVERVDNPAMRGIVAKVPHLLRIVD